LKKGDRLLLGNIESKRDYLFVEDLTRGVTMTINNKNAYSEIINLGTGVGTSAIEVIEALKLITQKQIEVDASKKLMRIVDSPVLVASRKKAKNLLGWEPEYSLMESLKKTIES
jgi:UDP-glucose 4-epimerase